MADAITGNTQLVSTKQDLVVALVQKELQAAAKLLPTVTDYSAFAIKGAKSIKIPRLSSFTVVDRASGAAGDATVLTSSTDDLALDKAAYVAWIIDSQDEIQTAIDAQMMFAARAAAAHGRFVDSAIITEFEAVGVATTTAGAIDRDIVLEMREELLSNDADPNSLYLALSVDQEAELLKVDEFTRADVYGSSNIPDGMIGKVYGVNVVISNLLGASTFYMYDKAGLAVAFQQQPQMSEQGANEYGANAKRVALDQLFGVKGLQIAEKGVPAGKSALVVKDNN